VVITTFHKKHDIYSLVKGDFFFGRSLLDEYSKIDPSIKQKTNKNLKLPA